MLLLFFLRRGDGQGWDEDSEPADRARPDLGGRRLDRNHTDKRTSGGVIGRKEEQRISSASTPNLAAVGAVSVSAEAGAANKGWQGERSPIRRHLPGASMTVSKPLHFCLFCVFLITCCAYDG